MRGLEISGNNDRQLYLWPFADAVKANATSVMCSYNKFNETWACESDAILNGLLKDELDFQGYVVSGMFGTTGPSEC